MSNETCKEVCPVCAEGHLAILNDHTYSFWFEDVEHKVENLSHQVCDSCGTSMFGPSQLNANHAKVREYQATLEGYISPSQILSIREIYLLPQEDANTVFADGAVLEGETLYGRWESGQGAPSRAQAAVMLKALFDKDYMLDLATARNVPVTMPEVRAA